MLGLNAIYAAALRPDLSSAAGEELNRAEPPLWIGSMDAFSFPFNSSGGTDSKVGDEAAEPRPEFGPAAAATPSGAGYWTAVFDYEATAEDELSLRKGDRVEVLSKDSLVSGDEGWWTGTIEDRVGIFPSNYVSSNGISEKIRDTPEDYGDYSVPQLHCK